MGADRSLWATRTTLPSDLLLWSAAAAAAAAQRKVQQRIFVSGI